MGITITLYWWVFPIVLFIFPVIYGMFRKSGGSYDFHLDTMLILVGCWALGIGLMVGHYLGE